MSILKIYWTFHDVLGAICLGIVVLLLIVALFYAGIKEIKKKMKGGKDVL